MSGMVAKTCVVRSHNERNPPSPASGARQQGASEARQQGASRARQQGASRARQ